MIYTYKKALVGERFSSYVIDSATMVQIQDNAVYISHSAKNLGTDKNPTIHSPG